MYCNDVSGLLDAMGVRSYDSKEWRLFLDSSNSSLKCVLLHNGNNGAIPIGHSVHLKEEYGHIKLVLKLLKYNEHNWVICVDSGSKTGELLTWSTGRLHKISMFPLHMG